MSPYQYTHRSKMPFSAETVFQWHEKPGAFQRLNPPWERVHILQQTGGIRDGARVSLRVPFGPIGLRWEIEHQDYIENRQFRDIQRSGPFAFWEHTHRIEPDTSDSCFLEDRIEYLPPFGSLGAILSDRLIRHKLSRMFTYRHQQTQSDITAHQRFIAQGSQKILITGSSGLIGSALSSFLKGGGHSIAHCVRNPSKNNPQTVLFPTSTNPTQNTGWEGFDAVIHLAGENIAGRWTPSKKQRIRESRIDNTHTLCQALANLTHPPKTLICASAIGFYGNRFEEICSEQSPPGNDFLAETCREWENATRAAVQAGIRVVNIRIGVVLTPAGGALAQMLTPFQWGMGGVVGNGCQYMSWISHDDLIKAIHHALFQKTIQGPINLVSPNPVTNREFTQILGKVLHRPTRIPLPVFAVRTLFGEMGEALLLSSTRVSSQCILDSGYTFEHPQLEAALRHMLGK